MSAGEVILLLIVLAAVAYAIYLANEQRQRRQGVRKFVEQHNVLRAEGRRGRLAAYSTETGGNEMAEGTQASSDEKKRALSQVVVQAVTRGGRVESQTDEQAIIVFEEHDLLRYIFLTIITFGLYWLGGWMFYRPKKHRRQVIRIDDFGNALVEDV